MAESTTKEKAISKKNLKKIRKEKDLKFASRQLIQILGINPRIPVALQDKVKEIQTSADAEAKGLPWINQIIRALGKVPKSAASVIRARKEAVNPRIPVAEQKKDRSAA